MNKNDHHQHRHFRLTRYFALAGLASIVVAALVLGQLYRYFAEQQLVRSEERHNAELTEYFASNIWPRFGEFLTSRQGQDGDAIRNHPESAALHQVVLDKLRESRILKIKMFDTAGLTVYSTVQDEIGKLKTGYPGFEQAKLGRVTSHLSFRDRFYANASDRELRDRNLLSSYVPIHGASGRIDGVVELYNDVTPLLQEIHATHLRLILATIAVMVGLYSALFVIIKRADRIIQEKSAAQRENERQIQHQANHDTLTGLPNRRRFRELLEERMAAADRDEYLIALLYIDLDRFKPINDTLGHQIGDELLKVVAKRLTDCCRDNDVVARIGGDEFTVILDHLDHISNVDRAAQRIVDMVSQPVYLADKELTVGASVGVALHPFEDVDIDGLMKHADTAMYQAKESGRNCFRYYSEAMNAASLQRMALERDLRDALRLDQFELHYQPRLDLASGEVASVEALLRWRHPERGLVPPDRFIPLAEEIGLIKTIGHWVLTEACDQISALDDHPGLGVSVNVSASQLDEEHFVVEVGHVLKSTGLAASRLELELTESMLMRNCDECLKPLRNLKSLGVRLALDDFGTGYSSLSYLKHLPLDTLKIDRSFISDVTDDSRNAALASTIAGLGRKLGMHVTAEGVETNAQMAFVTECECHEVQGYLIARPMPLADLKRFLAKSGGRSAASSGDKPAA